MYCANRSFSLKGQVRAVINNVEYTFLKKNLHNNSKHQLKHLLSYESGKKSKILTFSFKNDNFFHSASIALSKKELSEEIKLPFYEFDKLEKKNKKTFLKTVRLYEDNSQKQQSHVDFIRIALGNMEKFGVHKDLDCYKSLINVFPRGKYVTHNRLLAEAMYFPKEQYAAIDILKQMAHFGVNSDIEIDKMLLAIFGKLSYPYKVHNQMMYWFIKFKNKTPWPIPKPVPSDQFLLGKLAIERITSVDIHTEISVFQTDDIPDSIDKTWIVSGQSAKQRELLSKHSTDAPVIVEGGDIVWLDDKFVTYFILKADSEPIPYQPPPEINDLKLMQSPYFNPHYEERRNSYSVHEQDDGIIYAVCATGTSSRDSLLSWVRLLQKNKNPILREVPVLFRLKSIGKEPSVYTEAVTVHEKQD